jgi:hypothetical protein
MRNTCIVCLVVLFGGNSVLADPLPAFPGAEGFGAFSVGGRGGQVIEVTNLNDSGTGSLRKAIETSGPRIIVFEVSGNIFLQSRLTVRNPYVTIAGQTAPGDGIAVIGQQVTVNTHDVIIRYMRFRASDLACAERDALDDDDNQYNVIIDHCTASWAIDETLTFYKGHDFTVQWCMITESLYHSCHSKGPHGYGGIWGGTNSSFHHNLFAHHSSRNPRFAAEPDDPDDEGYLVDHRNNVIYNWGFNSAYGGEDSNMNIINNYYKYGPSTASSVKMRIFQASNAYAKAYINGNYVYGYPSITADNWFDGGVAYDNGASMSTLRVSNPFTAAEVSTTSAEQAYIDVLADAGATFPSRDAVDTRIVNDVVNRTGQLIDCVQGSDFYCPTGYARAATSNTITLAASASTYNDRYNGQEIEILAGTGVGQIRTISDYVGSTRVATVSTSWSTIPDTTSQYGVIINCTKNAGGWPVLQSTTPPSDADHDGMPDEWELALCLNPHDSNDANDYRDDEGYTNIEEYINWLPLGEPMPTRANVNCDDIVNFYDLSEFAEHYGSSFGTALYDEKYDFNSNGVISIDDLFYIAHDWLWCSQD